MENGLYVAASRQLTLRRSLDIVADNIANANTAGFKVESLGLTQDVAHSASHSHGPKPTTFVDDWALLRNFTQGAIEVTGRPLDVAIEGDGFFAVQNGDETAYTRDGRFSLNGEGELVTQTGQAVLDTGNQPITLEQAARIEIDTRGVVFADGDEVAQLGVVSFDNQSGLSRLGKGLFVAPEGVVAQPMAEDTRLTQEAVEGSNVTPISEITRLIEITRTYESVTRMIKNAEDLSKRTIERLGRVS